MSELADLHQDLPEEPQAAVPTGGLSLFEKTDELMRQMADDGSNRDAIMAQIRQLQQDEQANRASANAQVLASLSEHKVSVNARLLAGINKLGADGWELILVLDGATPENPMAIFKRAR